MRFALPTLALLTACTLAGCDNATPMADSTDTKPAPAADDVAQSAPAEDVADDAPTDAPEMPEENPYSNTDTYPFDFSLTSIDGKTLTKADYEGKVLVVDIWGTWCPPCRAEVPHFIELQKELGDQGLQIVGINYENGDTPEDIIKTIEGFTADVPINYPLMLGDDATREQVPGFKGFPTTIFIDRTGKVRRTETGAREIEVLRSFIEPLLAEK